MSKITGFDVVSFLEDRAIEIHYPGEKNVSEGWIAINCIYCDDPSWHLGINLTGRQIYISCYSCKQAGTIKDLILDLLGEEESLKSILTKYQGESEVPPARGAATPYSSQQTAYPPPLCISPY